jgi:hypothetical protein
VTQSLSSFESLESRRLLSITLPPGAGRSTDPTIVADRAKLMTDIQQYRKDLHSTGQTLAGDRKAVAAELKVFVASDNADDAQLATLRKQLRTDLAAQNKEIRGDLQTIRTESADARQAVLGDEKDLRAARLAHDASAITAAQGALKADQKKLHDIVAPLRAELTADQTKWHTTISGDHRAIENRIGALDTKFGTLLHKLESDQSAAQTAIKADRDAVRADLKELRTDLAALHPTGSSSNA